MKLSELHKYQEIVIQCHDNPDADSIGSGYALYVYFQSLGKKVRLIYSGRYQMTKANTKLLVEDLHIPLEYVQEMEVPEMLLTVDCQYGAGNVTKFLAKNVAVIDHHHQEIDALPMQEIRNYLASSATIVWDLLRKEHFVVNEYSSVSTALYYGLFTDSNGFTEVYHPLDKDMRDSLKVDQVLIRKLRNCVLSLSELEIAGMALIRHSYNPIYRFVVIKANRCDPNILGFISDLALQVDSVDVCVVYNEQDGGIKFSVRSCVKQVMANELAMYLAENIGSGGGHIEKAGGTIKEKKFVKFYSGLNADEYFLTRLNKYYQSFEVVYTDKYIPILEEFKKYKKYAVSVGVVFLEEIISVGTTIVIRTLNRDNQVVVEKNQVLIIELNGNIEIVEKNVLYQLYQILEESIQIECEYFPSVWNVQEGKEINLKTCIKKAMPIVQTYVYAKKLEKSMKVFKSKESDYYQHAREGDYLIVSTSNPQKISILEKKKFQSVYQQVES